MLDDKQSSIFRPKAVPPMFTPNLPPAPVALALSSTIMATRPPSQAHVELSLLLRKHDPDAIRLFDCIGQVKLFLYNSNELRWENTSNIDGMLLAYERQPTIQNKIYPSYAFAIINNDTSVIQPITVDMVQHADKLRLFYEVARNGRREVFCLHFLTESECHRLYTFLTRIHAKRNAQEQQQQQQTQLQQQQQTRAAMLSAPGDPQFWPQPQSNGQTTPKMPIQSTSEQFTPTNIHRQPIMQLPNPTITNSPQYGSSRVTVNQTPTRLNASSAVTTQPPIPSFPSQLPLEITNINGTRATTAAPTAQVEVPKPIEPTQFPPSPISMTNGSNNNNNNNNTEDPTLSLKRLLNIRSQGGLDAIPIDETPVYPKIQQNQLDLLPPSAFEPIAVPAPTPPSPVVAIGAERVKHRLSQSSTINSYPSTTMNREHFRKVLLHLVQNDDHFLDIIYQACLTHPPSSSTG